MNPEMVRKALLALLDATRANKANPGGTVYAPDQVTNPGAVTGFRDTNLRDARQQAQQVQGEDPLIQPLRSKEFHPDENQFEPPIPRTSPKDPSRLPDQGGLDSQLVRVRPQDSPDPNIPFVETRGHRMMRGGLDNPRDPNIEQGLLYPGEPGFEAQVARGGYGQGLSPGSPGYDAINKANLEEAGIRQAEVDAYKELDPQSAFSRQEMNEAMEAEYSFLQKEFERLAGRPPMPDETKDIGTLENLVDLLKDASGETRVPRASNLNPLDDDIPF